MTNTELVLRRDRSVILNTLVNSKIDLQNLTQLQAWEDHVVEPIQASVCLKSLNLFTLGGLKFTSVAENFDCSNNRLMDLHGCPILVELDFDCSNNKLMNLLGGPTTVLGNYCASKNMLTSLKGCPHTVDSLYVADNMITTLESELRVVKDRLDLDYNYLENLISPIEYVGSTLSVRYNKLTSTRGIPAGLLHLNITGNYIASCRKSDVVTTGLAIFNDGHYVDGCD